jgi:hypothetical protein
LFNRDTWAAYILNGEAFVKRSKADPAKTYTDFGCSFETFTNKEFLEIETLGPMTNLLPGETVEHIEDWALFRDVRVVELTDKELDEVLFPLVQTDGATK